MAPPSKADYDALATTDAPEYTEQIPFVMRYEKKTSRLLVSILIGTIITLAITTVVLSTRPMSFNIPDLCMDVSNTITTESIESLHISHDTHEDATLMKSPCGTTAAEAEARGCHFDLIRLAWLPDACKDEELLSEFYGVVDGIPIYKDEEGTMPMEVSELPYSTHVIWSHRVFHKHHCAFSLIKMHRALAGGRMVDSSMNLHHTRHCSFILMNTTIPNNVIGTRVNEIDFPDCLATNHMKEYAH